MAALYELTNSIRQLYDMAEEDDDFYKFTDTFKDTYEGLEGEFSDKVANIGRLVKSLESDAKELDAEAKSLAQREKSLEKRSKWLKDYLLKCMKEANIRESGDTITKVRIQNNGGKIPLILDTDVEEIPAEYQKVSYAPDNDKIREALDNGENLPFAHYGERGESVRIK